MVARLERGKAPDRRTGRVGQDTPGYPDRLAEDAWIRIDLFRRLTAQEIQATLKDSGRPKKPQEPQQIRYSARVQVASAISRETFILHRKLATIIDRTQDMDIRKLLKALYQRYLCLDIEELCEDGDTGFICELIEEANAHLEKTKLGLKIHLRNRFALLGPEKGYEAISVVNNEETRKTMHYTGVKIAKPVPVSAPAPVLTQAQAKDSPEAPKEAAPEKGSYLYCVRANRDKFKGKLADIDYTIAEGIAQAVDRADSALGDDEGTTISKLEKQLGIADHIIASRMKAVGRKFQKIGITLDIEEDIADADMDEASENWSMNYFYRITLFWTESLESDFGAYEPVEKEGEDGDSDKDEDDEDDAPKKGARGKTPSRWNAEYLKKKEDPNDIFEAFRGVKFTTAKQFNDTITEILASDGICTYEGDVSSDNARKLMRSVNACEVDDSIEDRVNEWKRRLSLGMGRFKKYGCLYRGAVAGLLKGINVNDDET